MRGLCYFFLSVLTQASSSTVKVIGFLGHNVTLPCRYDARAHGVLSFCWGRAEVPVSKCSNTILSSQDGAVVFRESPRYQLLGRATDGDVSLTIRDAQLSDAGVYGCRLEVPGWFNDEKVNTHLFMEEAPVEPTVTQDWTLTTDGRQDILTTSLSEKVGYTLAITGISTEEKFKGVLEVGNIGRIVAVFSPTIIIILVFVFRRRFLPQRGLTDLNPSSAENIYETL